MSSLSGCKGSSQMNDSNHPSSQKEISFDVIIQEAHSGFQEPSEMLITDKKKLKEVYEVVNKTRLPGVEVPEIDFNRDMLILVCMGQKNTGGYSIAVERIISSPESTKVYISTTAPTGMATMVITAPFVLVKLPKQKGTIQFEYASE